MIDHQQITLLHEEAMELAERGIMERDSSRARGFFRSAFEKERAAAEFLVGALKEEPNRSVLYRSAATLAMDCGELGEAERLIDDGLSGEPVFHGALAPRDPKRLVSTKASSRKPE